MSHAKLYSNITVILLILGGLFLLICIILFSVALTPSSCLKHHDYPFGGGEMNFCVVEEDDDDVKFSFDDKEENKVRSDSTLYLLAPPFNSHTVTRQVSAKLNGEDFINYHYMFTNDTISGVVKCKGECKVTVVSKSSLCVSLTRFVNRSSNSRRDLDIVDNIVKRPHRYTAVDALLDLFFYAFRCTTYSETLFKEKKEGTIDFNIKIKTEASVYVAVEDASSATVIYSISETQFDVSKPIDTCNNYTCSFSNLTGNGRDTAYLAINMFSENISQPYEMVAKSWVSKNKSIGASIGFGVTTAVLFLAAFVFLCMYLYVDYCDQKKKQKERVPEQKTPQGTTEPLVTPGAEMTPGGDVPLD